MAVIAYKNYLFVEPAYINADVYEYYKKALFTDVNFHINAGNESFIGKFKKKLIFLIVALPIASVLILSFLHFKDTPDLSMIAFRIIGVSAIILSFISFFVLIILLLEGSSYAVYLNNKQQFFIGLEHAIKTSNNYTDFELLFYGGLKNVAKNYKVRAKEAMAINKPPTTIDSVFITIFRIVDVLTVIIGLVGIILFIKYYFFDK